MTHAHTAPYGEKRRLFFGALSLFLILFSLYVYFVSAAVVHVVARKEIDREITDMHSRIGDLESAYIAARQSIDIETITQYGFVTSSAQKIYVRRAPTNLALVIHGTN